MHPAAIQFRMGLTSNAVDRQSAQDETVGFLDEWLLQGKKDLAEMEILKMRGCRWSASLAGL